LSGVVVSASNEQKSTMLRDIQLIGLCVMEGVSGWMSTGPELRSVLQMLRLFDPAVSVSRDAVFLLIRVTWISDREMSTVRQDGTCAALNSIAAGMRQKYKERLPAGIRDSGLGLHHTRGHDVTRLKEKCGLSVRCNDDPNELPNLSGDRIRGNSKAEGRNHPASIARRHLGQVVGVVVSQDRGVAVEGGDKFQQSYWMANARTRQVRAFSYQLSTDYFAEGSKSFFRFRIFVVLQPCTSNHCGDSEV
jgi:hypothetical protein